MGLFSVLDVILEKTMEEALQMVMVTGEVREALLYRTGVLAPVLDLVKQYESANWPEVSRQLLLQKLDADTVSQAYETALKWYRDLM
jgi:EAL and modified HD-GYP domain-containing signal transduction protein